MAPICLANAADFPVLDLKSQSAHIHANWIVYGYGVPTS
jgi:hypothetical protein